jgi:hypothetical protein
MQNKCSIFLTASVFAFVTVVTAVVRAVAEVGERDAEVVFALVHALGAEAAVGESRRAVHFITEIATVTVAVAPEV